MNTKTTNYYAQASKYQSGADSQIRSTNPPKNMKITIIGTGNIAQSLAPRLIQKGAQIPQIYGRNKEKTTELANQLRSQPITQLENINQHSDLYIIAVTDTAIPEIAKALAPNLPPTALVVHTSGTTPSNILQPHFQHFGTLYPLQTFSPLTNPDFNHIPIFINASTPEDLITIQKAALLISPKVELLTDEKRAALHIAAVFANNFTNYLFTIAEEILQKENIPFNILLPLITETIHKIQTHSPKQMQTGPAKRNDNTTIQKHQEYLKTNFPQALPIYQLLTNNIINTQSSNKTQ